ncbi:thioredoxin-disulfide reductase [Spirochaetia bacterium]|nr:thioredoxin-disulfide reductase [Spirochaetia bacterium]
MSTTDADLIIIGAGPAGLTAAQYGARANLKVLAIEQLAPGGQALLIDVLENYPGNVGVGDAPPKTGFEFSRDLHQQAESFGAVFLTDSVLSLTREGNLFTLTLGNGETRTAPAVILATGAQHRTLDVPGEAEFSGRGVSYCATCDGPFFRNKKIFVAGGGDAACDEAQYLSRLSSQVVLVHRRSRFRAQKALAERALRNPNIEVRFNTRIKEIRGGVGNQSGGALSGGSLPVPQKVASVILERTGEDGKSIGGAYEEAADAVFIFAGTIPQTSLAPEAEKDENGYIITDQKMASSVPGLFVAGDVRAGPFRQVVVAAAEGAIAAHCAAEYLDRLNG